MQLLHRQALCLPETERHEIVGGQFRTRCQLQGTHTEYVLLVLHRIALLKACYGIIYGFHSTADLLFLFLLMVKG